MTGRYYTYAEKEILDDYCGNIRCPGRDLSFHNYPMSTAFHPCNQKLQNIQHKIGYLAGTDMLLVHMTNKLALHSKRRVVALENHLKNITLVGVTSDVTHPVT